MQDGNEGSGAVVARLSPPPSPFMEMIRTIGDGTFEHQLSAAVVELTAELLASGAAGGKPSGSFELKVKIKFDRGLFTVEPVLNVKAPKPVAPLTVMYPALDGGLSRNNPKQQAQMDAFREGAPAAATSLRDLNVGSR